MEFYDITEDAFPHPGEYIYYVPSRAVVLCGAYMGTRIKALYNGKLVEDKVENFKKIKIGIKEKRQKFTSRCKACGK